MSNNQKEPLSEQTRASFFQLGFSHANIEEAYARTNGQATSISEYLFAHFQ